MAKLVRGFLHFIDTDCAEERSLFTAQGVVVSHFVNVFIITNQKVGENFNQLLILLIQIRAK